MQHVFDQKEKNSCKIMYLLMIFKVYCESQLLKASRTCINYLGLFLFFPVLNFLSLEYANIKYCL